MNRFLRVMSFLVAVAVMAPSLAAQWPAYPTPNVPKTAAGTPDLNGPTPRTADGKPDLSGLWQVGGPRGAGGNGGARGGNGGGNRGGGQRGANAATNPPGGPRGAAPGATPGANAAGAPQGGPRGGAPGANPPGPPPVPPLPADGIPIATFGNAGQGMQGGLPLQKWAADLVAQRKADFSKDNPDAHCLPMGFMQFHNHPEPRKIIQTPGMVLIIYEANSGLRQIFTDGRSLPGPDAEPWWYGYSVGKWDGDTFVVTTTNFRDGGWLDVQGDPLTDAAKVTEKFRRPNFGT